MTEDLARDIVRDAEALRRRNFPVMIATITLVPLPPNLAVPGQHHHSHVAHAHADLDAGINRAQSQSWFAVRGVEPGKTERTFLYAEEAISYAASHGFRRLVGEEEREWTAVVKSMNSSTGRHVGDPIMTLAKDGKK